MAEDKFRSPIAEAQDDYYSILRGLIDRVTNEPVQVRNIVYALAWHHFKAEALTSSPLLDGDVRTKAICVLEKAKELANAIERLELEASQSGNSAKLKSAPLPRQDSNSRARNAVALVPEQQFQLQRQVVDQRRSSPETIHYAPVSTRRQGFMSAAKFAAFAILLTVVAISAFAWIYATRELAASISDARALLTPLAANGLRSRQGGSEPDNALPFPIPKTFGIYAINNGQLVQLEKLPIRVPDPRVQLSAEIHTPSRVVVSDGDLSFLIFGREPMNSAPETVVVRVVAKVVRETKFLAGKAVVLPVESSWRIRSKAFAFKLEPVDRHPEMILVRPDKRMALPAGRYALVLAGQGYEFNVAGPITAPEQCLEQVHASNGLVLSECSKSK